MTKNTIVRRIAEQVGLPFHEAHCAVQHTIDAITATLVADGRLELRGFGVFEVKRRAPRSARNPRTGESISVPETWKVIFKPSSTMTARVQQPDVVSLPIADAADDCQRRDAA
jgi:nucleoid DNA-binding protein